MQKEAKENEAEAVVPEIREGMLTSVGLSEKYSISSMTAKNILDDLNAENAKFTDESGKEHLMVEKVKARTLTTLALHEHPNALLAFKAYYQQRTGKELIERPETEQINLAIIKKFGNGGASLG